MATVKISFSQTREHRSATTVGLCVYKEMVEFNSLQVLCNTDFLTLTEHYLLTTVVKAIAELRSIQIRNLFIDDQILQTQPVPHLPCAQVIKHQQIAAVEI